VEEVRPPGERVQAGDHVIACLSVFCGHCDYCLTGKTTSADSPVARQDGSAQAVVEGPAVNQFANLSAYAEKMLVHEKRS